MSLNMYLGETDTQKSSMNAMCVDMILAMEEMQSSINSFTWNITLRGQTYDSAKAYLNQVYLPLTQGIIYLCEELIWQNDKYPNDFRTEVSSSNVVEEEARAQIDEIDSMIIHLQDLNEYLPLFSVQIIIYQRMKSKLLQKLSDLYVFNSTSSSNYTTAKQFAENVLEGLNQIKDGNGFNKASGTFNTDGIDMSWMANLWDTQKEATVSRYEDENPEDAKKVDEFLSPLEEEDTNEIKYLMYTADEPYRSLALQYLHRLEIIDIDASKGRFFHKTNEMQFNVAKDRNGDKGSYMTFFHELGHAIDYNVGVDRGEDWFFSESHVWNNGTLSDHMFKDVRSRIQTEVAKEMDQSKYNDLSIIERAFMMNNIMEKVIYTGPSDVELTNAEEEIFDTVTSKLSTELRPDEDHAASDVFGGVTLNEIKGKWAHHDLEYWVDENEERIRGPNREGFANYFGTMMLEDGNFKETKLNSFEEHLSISKEHMDEIIKEMAGEEG